MKKSVLLFLVLFVSCSLFAGEKTIDGFWGIEFQSDKAAVKEAMLLKDGFKLTEEKSDVLVYTGGRWSGEKVENICFRFLYGQFYKAEVSVLPADEKQVFNMYRSLVEKMEERYFPSPRSVEKFDIPLATPEEREKSALAFGAFEVYSQWPMENQTQIQLTVLRNRRVLVSYTLLPMERVAVERKKDREMGDL